MGQWRESSQGASESCRLQISSKRQTQQNDDLPLAPCRPRRRQWNGAEWVSGDQIYTADWDDKRGQEWSRLPMGICMRPRKAKIFVEELVSPEVLMVRESTFWLNFQPPRSTCPSKGNCMRWRFPDFIKVNSIVVTFLASHLNTHLSVSFIIDVEFPLFQNRELTKPYGSEDKSAIRERWYNDCMNPRRDFMRNVAICWNINRPKAFAIEPKTCNFGP